MIRSILFVIIYVTSTLGLNRLLLQAVHLPAPQPAVPVWVPPPIPSPNAHILQTEKLCVTLNTDPEGCAGKISTVTNPGRNFKMSCSAIGSCAASKTTFDFTNSMIERVEMVSFTEQYAGYNAEIIIDSTHSAMNQYIDKFECKAPSACLGTTVRCVGGASINDVDCPYPDFCTGCTIEICHWDPLDSTVLLCGTPKPCFGY